MTYSLSVSGTHHFNVRWSFFVSHSYVLAFVGQGFLCRLNKGKINLLKYDFCFQLSQVLLAIQDSFSFLSFMVAWITYYGRHTIKGSLILLPFTIVCIVYYGRSTRVSLLENESDRKLFKENFSYHLNSFLLAIKWWSFPLQCSLIFFL